MILSYYWTPYRNACVAEMTWRIPVKPPGLWVVGRQRPTNIPGRSSGLSLLLELLLQVGLVRTSGTSETLVWCGGSLISRFMSEETMFAMPSGVSRLSCLSVSQDHILALLDRGLLLQINKLGNLKIIVLHNEFL